MKENVFDREGHHQLSPAFSFLPSSCQCWVSSWRRSASALDPWHDLKMENEFMPEIDDEEIVSGHVVRLSLNCGRWGALCQATIKRRTTSTDDQHTISLSFVSLNISWLPCRALLSFIMNRLILTWRSFLFFYSWLRQADDSSWGTRQKTSSKWKLSGNGLTNGFQHTGWSFSLDEASFYKGKEEKLPQGTILIPGVRSVCPDGFPSFFLFIDLIWKLSWNFISDPWSKTTSNRWAQLKKRKDNEGKLPRRLINNFLHPRMLSLSFY